MASSFAPSRLPPVSVSSGTGVSGPAIQPLVPSKVRTLPPLNMRTIIECCAGALPTVSTGTLSKAVSNPAYVPLAVKLVNLDEAFGAANGFQVLVEHLVRADAGVDGEAARVGILHRRAVLLGKVGLAPRRLAAGVACVSR